MGNCQATDATVVLLQHPGGRVERIYFPTNAGEVMRSNPGFYVALITVALRNDVGSPRVTRVRLLRAKDTLMLGQAYRLVTSQEVVKGLRARKQEKLRVLEEAKAREEDGSSALKNGDGNFDVRKVSLLQGPRQERRRQKSSTKSMTKVRQWQPSLQSIAEMAN